MPDVDPGVFERRAARVDHLQGELERDARLAFGDVGAHQRRVEVVRALGGLGGDQADIGSYEADRGGLGAGGAGEGAEAGGGDGRGREGQEQGTAGGVGHGLPFVSDERQTVCRAKTVAAGDHETASGA